MKSHVVFSFAVGFIPDIRSSDRAGADVAQLLRQFENIIALAPVRF